MPVETLMLLLHQRHQMLLFPIVHCAGDPATGEPENRLEGKLSQETIVKVSELRARWSD